MQKLSSPVCIEKRYIYTYYDAQTAAIITFSCNSDMLLFVV